MSNSVKSNIKFNAFATKVTAGPPIGPILGQQGIPIMDFCKSFNHDTESYNKNIPLRVTMTVFNDKTYKYNVSLPSTMFFIKHILEQTNSNKLSIYWVYEIARLKQQHDMKGYDLQSICKMVLSTLKSANIQLA